MRATDDLPVHQSAETRLVETPVLKRRDKRGDRTPENCLSPNCHSSAFPKIRPSDALIQVSVSDTTAQDAPRNKDIDIKPAPGKGSLSGTAAGETWDEPARPRARARRGTVYSLLTKNRSRFSVSAMLCKIG